MEQSLTSKLKVINLFAGPGAGKSTLRAGLFFKLKSLGVSCEEVTEYAKDLTWDKNTSALSDQLFILANQNRRLQRLQGKVEWVISDSPLLLNLNYVVPAYLPKTFRELVFELWDTYDNKNFFINRSKAYVTAGRNQTEEEAKKLDQDILDMLEAKRFRYDFVPGTIAGPGIIASTLGFK